jgi:N6-adenosine-specific RNA methylase IME4/predicted transcriptional regulator
MTPEDAEEYTSSLGQIVAGSWRQIALAKRLGIPKALGLEVDQWVRERLGGYIKLSIAERREAVKNLTEDGYSTREMADILGVSHQTVANTVNNLTPLDAVATLAAEETVQRIIKREERDRERQEHRDAKHVEDGCTVDDLQTLITGGKKFGVIYADPPWVYKVYSGKGKKRSADRHYKENEDTGERTLSIEDLKALPILDLAADDCALFLWAVMPELPGALEVMNAWGFAYKTTAFVWVKTSESASGIALNGDGLHWGMGYWTRANAEVCLFGTRGAPKRNAKNIHQILISPVGEHSRKPEQTNARIERLVDGPYLEMFGRRPMPRWTVWGNDISRGLFHGNIPHIGEAAE